MYPVYAILVMAGVTAILRFLPFLVMGERKTPEYINYLGKVLPYAVMAMLVVYCLKDISFLQIALWLPALVSTLLVVWVHIWKRNTLLSIVIGTLCYMVLIRVM